MDRRESIKAESPEAKAFLDLARKVVAVPKEEIRPKPDKAKEPTRDAKRSKEVD